MHDSVHRVQPLHSDGPRRLNDILVELLAQYQSRFPNAPITVIETADVRAAEPYVFDPAAASQALSLLR
jgi:hypothetical protein